MLKLQRVLAFFLTTVLFVSACAAPVTPVAPVAQAPDTAATTESPAESTTSSTAIPEGERVIEHVLGEITLPAPPQRVVALEWTYAEDLLALGMQPVGVADIEGYNAWVKIPVELSPDVVDVGTRQAPNLELIATLAPDLIIVPSFRLKDNYDELSAIAPTLVFDAYPTGITHYEEMRQTFTTIADIVGWQSEGEAVLAELEEKFAGARAQLETAGKAGEKFALAQAFSSENQAQVRVFTNNALATQVIEQIGLDNGWEDAAQPYGYTTVSVEALPELGDLNFFYVVQDDDNVFTTAAVAPIWESLAFVQNGHAYPLGGDTWLFGGPLSVSLLVDIVMDALVPDAAALPATIFNRNAS